MKLEKTLCPYCGAGLKIRHGQRTVECEYCGSSVLITDDRAETDNVSSADHRQSSLDNSPLPSGSGQSSLDRTPEPLEWTPVSRTGSENRSGARNERGRVSPVHGKTRADTGPWLQRLFPPPGFRSRNILHMITAVTGYLFILYIAADLNPALESVFFVIASLAAVDVCTDWTGFYSRLAGVGSDSTMVRLVMKTIWSIAVFVAWIVLMALVEVFLPF